MSTRRSGTSLTDITKSHMVLSATQSAIRSAAGASPRNGTTVTWIASSPDARREQFGRFLLGTGNIGGLAATTGPGIGLSDDEGRDLIDRALT